MASLFLFTLVGLTSVGAYVLGTRGLGLSRHGLCAAIGQMLETIGMILIFFVINLMGGLLVLLVGRALLREFVSLYLLSEIGLLGFSVLQGLTFQGWREVVRHRGSEIRSRSGL